MKQINHLFSVAPMMDWTDRPCRSFLRLLSKRTLLYTEMLHAKAVLLGEREKLLRFPAMQQPVALQLGGSEPEDLAAAARIGEQYGYDEINLNVGCPSDRVQAGNFGAALMLKPELSAQLVKAMCEAVDIPVTVKCRIGVDEQDAEKDFNLFVDRLAAAGCNRFVIHARKAWLQGLSPKDNRDVPPLDYERVYRLKQRRPDLQIVINGGIADLDQCEQHLRHVDAVMLGRAAYHDPYLLASVDSRIYGEQGDVLSRAEVVERMMPLIEEEMAAGLRLNQITRHMMGLYLGQAGARIWRTALGAKACRKGAGVEMVQQAALAVEAAREAAGLEK